MESLTSLWKDFSVRGDRVERGEKASHEFVDFGFGDHEGRRKTGDIAVRAVGLPHVRPHYQSLVSRALREAFGKVLASRKWSTCATIGDELDTGKEANSAHVTDDMVLSKDLKLLVEINFHVAAAFEQRVSIDVIESCDTHCARDGVM